MSTAINSNIVLGREEVYKASPRIWSFKYADDIVNGINLSLSGGNPFECGGYLWRGQNNIGKILMICRDSIRKKVEPRIDYDLLRCSNIYLFDKLLTFEKQ